MRELLANWRELAPPTAAVLLLGLAAFFAFRRREPEPRELERQRRTYLNRVGRIVEGQILEIVERPIEPSEKSRSSKLSLRGASRSPARSCRKLLYYTYSISGVTYETAQDISGLEERAVLDKAVAGQSASVKYDPSNPSNSILIADDWSGLH